MTQKQKHRGVGGNTSSQRWDSCTKPYRFSGLDGGDREIDTYVVDVTWEAAASVDGRLWGGGGGVSSSEEIESILFIGIKNKETWAKVSDITDNHAKGRNQ